MTVAVRFLKDRGSRKVGDVVQYDDTSAARIVTEGAAEYVDPVASTPDTTQTGYEISDPEPGFKTASVEDGD